MIIKTERLTLRPFKESDALDLYEYLKEPLVHCFMCMKIDSVEAAKREITNRINDEFYFAIELNENHKVIGEISGHIESADPEQKDYDTVSPCWMLNKLYQRKGYMHEAVKAYFNYLFNDIGVRRIYIYTEDYNVSCQKLCEKLGVRKEGEFKEFVSFVKDSNGKPIYENTWQYAILSNEWNKK